MSLNDELNVATLTFSCSFVFGWKDASQDILVFDLEVRNGFLLPAAATCAVSRTIFFYESKSFRAEEFSDSVCPIPELGIVAVGLVMIAR